MQAEHVANPQGTPDFHLQLPLAFVLFILLVRFFFVTSNSRIVFAMVSGARRLLDVQAFTKQIVCIQLGPLGRPIHRWEDNIKM
jgi:hypothetical protein